MKHLLTFIVLSAISFGIKAEEKRTFKKISEKNAEVTIHTEETDYSQAAAYVDGKENAAFIKMLLLDKSSELSRLKSEIELQNCEVNSTEDESWIPGCGEVTITPEIMTYFGRGGWKSAEAGYTFFIGFTHQGTGRFFAATHMVTIAEGAEAQVDDDYNYNGIVMKYLALINITELSQDSSNH